MQNQQLSRIISGGQTGIDQMGLEVAKSLDIPTGGTASKGYRTEDGPNEGLREFGLTEHTSPKYATRTRINIVQSDGTVLFGEQTSSGTKLTLEVCINLGKPHIINPSANQLRQWLR